MTEKPWYHGLKLVADNFCVENGYQTRVASVPRYGDPLSSTSIAFVRTDWDKSAPKDPYNLSFKRAEQFAALFATAPETAAERDALKAENERLREVLRAIQMTVYRRQLPITNDVWEIAEAALKESPSDEITGES